MTREKAKELWPIIKAYSEGGLVQCKYPHDETWTYTNIPSFVEHIEYRIKPTPTLRPWKLEEVPVGAQVRYKGNDKSMRLLIVSNLVQGLLGPGTNWSYSTLLERMEHSIDGGKTWHPCGVEE